jgi:hypothetical protein
MVKEKGLRVSVEKTLAADQYKKRLAQVRLPSKAGRFPPKTGCLG